MASGGDGLHQEISGGTQRNVVFAQVVENVSLHGDSDLHAGHGAGGPGARRNPGVAVLPYAVGLLGVFLLIARPELPLPARLDPGPVVGGGLLLAGTIGLSAWSWLRGKWAYRRRAAWRTRRTLDRAAEALAESLVVRYDEDERLRRLNDPHPLDVAWTTLPPPREESGEEEAPSARPGPPDIADYYTATPARRLVVLGGAGAGKSVLVLRLAHALLHRRTRGSGDPVPLIVSLASWDPDQGLLRWMAEQLADAHPPTRTRKPAPRRPTSRRRRWPSTSSSQVGSCRCSTVSTNSPSTAGPPPSARSARPCAAAGPSYSPAANPSTADTFSTSSTSSARRSTSGRSAKRPYGRISAPAGLPPAGHRSWTGSPTAHPPPHPRYGG
ncbi:hypothetical protein F3L20_12145 [Streptomyces tendae]|uniref:NACHT domain-containing protein n=1 Tax=Streptomyces tendae TaxID=1932 RepID=A0ABX5ZQL0_STRTE|nr:hypothetical protein F3L20_12145 [Streptomyces tendae]